MHTPVSVLLAGRLAPWTLTVRADLVGEVTLLDSEVRDLCAAIELDRVTRADAVALLTRRRVARKPLAWGDLMDGARGLTQGDVVSARTVAETLSRVGVEVVSWVLVESPRKALATMRGRA